MRIDVLTLFPGMFNGPLDESILARAQKSNLLEINVHDLRPYGIGRHRVCDDQPYGGGAGMVMRPEPLDAALNDLIQPPHPPREDTWIISLSPQGKTLTHQHVLDLTQKQRMIMICGHYEGIDERISELWVDEEISIGDYVLTGGELPALVLIDTVARFVPGVLGNEESAPNDSYAQSILDCPHYTRPEQFRGLGVPEILLSGHHAQIAAWRHREALRRTLLLRPDLLSHQPLAKEDQLLLEELRRELTEEQS